jgi:hypothetical protein
MYQTFILIFISRVFKLIDASMIQRTISICSEDHRILRLIIVIRRLSEDCKQAIVMIVSDLVEATRAVLGSVMIGVKLYDWVSSI